MRCRGAAAAPGGRLRAPSQAPRTPPAAARGATRVTHDPSGSAAPLGLGSVCTPCGAAWQPVSPFISVGMCRGAAVPRSPAPSARLPGPFRLPVPCHLHPRWTLGASAPLLVISPAPSGPPPAPACRAAVAVAELDKAPASCRRRPPRRPKWREGRQLPRPRPPLSGVGAGSCAWPGAPSLACPAPPLHLSRIRVPTEPRTPHCPSASPAAPLSGPLRPQEGQAGPFRGHRTPAPWRWHRNRGTQRVLGRTGSPEPRDWGGARSPACTPAQRRTCVVSASRLALGGGETEAGRKGLVPGMYGQGRRRPCSCVAMGTEVTATYTSTSRTHTCSCTLTHTCTYFCFLLFG